ncbi:MAG TPA: hypothetical protein PLM07_06500 [Candidatus Rifleibacterium sp.]|nr:hypothetical protein [Candidatus Rifleibacterium sp.]HPT45531.1 hypothetical protein [Candidatus Rifleibacterium sp.]
MNDCDIIHSESKEITDADGTVSIRIDWLRRPGEMAMTITYNGFLTQEGLANFYIDLNGQTRDFITMKQEMKNRAQRIRILSFHPTRRENGINRLVELPENTLVDSLLFRNAPYYEQFGTLNVAVKFFIHGRWDGDGNNNNENYLFSFTSRIKDMPQYHF